MKTLVIYSSLTGNTKKLAQAIANEMEDTEIISVDEFRVSMMDNFDFFMIGYWVDKGVCDDKSKEVLKHMLDKKVALFGTLGAKENTKYYDMVKAKVEEQAQGVHVIGHFLCQGSVGEKTMERYREMLKKTPDDIHLKAQLEAYEEGIHHPNELDIANAIRFAKSLLG